MSKPMTAEQIELLETTAAGPMVEAAIDAALARLIFLERKVAAADMLAGQVGIYIASGFGFVRTALASYEEITERPE